MTAARRAGLAMLLVVLAGAALLAALPDAGVVRVGGITLRWWLGGLVGPPVAAAVAMLVMPAAGARVRALAGWTGPALVAAVVAHVAAGHPAAPMLTLLACVVPLLVAFAAPAAPRPGGGLARALGGVALTLVLAADLTAAAGLARTLGVDRRAAVLAAAALAAAPLAAPSRAPLRALALATGVVGLLLAVGGVGAGVGLAPWTAWQSVAARPAIVLDPRSAWVTEGAALAAPTTLRFDEAHRVTAVGAATWRVVEHEGGHATVRDWRLGGGESLELRPGDALSLEPGARIRLQAGQRVPGAPPSGTAWAERRARGGVPGLMAFLGALLTMTGGAWLLLAARTRAGTVAAALAPPTTAAVAMAAGSWGVYAAFAGPDVMLGAPALGALARVPLALDAAPWPPLVVAGAALGLVALLLAAADTLRERLGGLGGGDRTRRRLAWGVAVAVAAGLALAAGDAWRWLTLGWGLAAAAWGAPALAAADPRARTAGAAAGALTFAALAAGVGGLDAWVPALGAWPALGAAPLAWGLTRALAR